MSTLIQATVIDNTGGSYNNSNNYNNTYMNNNIETNFFINNFNIGDDDIRDRYYNDSWKLQGIRLMKSQQYDQALEIFTKMLTVNLDHSIFTYRA